MNAISSALHFRPDYAAKPGDHLQEHLGHRGISARELARRCGRSAKLITEIILGKAPIEPETALQLERVLEVDASIWLGLEARYQLHLAREAENAELAKHEAWAKSFPVQALHNRDWLSTRSGGANLVREILGFFGVASIDAYKARLDDLLAVDCRTSPTYLSHIESLAAWLRVGELKAAEINAEDYDREAFIQALKAIRPLTLVSIEEAIPKIQDFCASAGVAFVLEQSLGKNAASGISRWLTPRRALIQQSGRYLRDDHFWFTFFHECAHLLLHSRKAVFIDVLKGKGSATTEQEGEANDWAADFLIPATAMRKFLRRFEKTEEEIEDFAEEVGVAPGIVVGQLQHRRVIGYHQMNHLRQKFVWIDDGG